MPGLNRKGPEGEGAMTGRQQGRCRRTQEQAIEGNGPGLGRGTGNRCGQGRGGNRRNSDENMLRNPPDNGANELQTIKEKYQAAQKTLRALEQKIASLESGK